MTHLLREFLGHSHHLIFPTMALVAFFCVFVIVLWRLVRGWMRHDSYDGVASLPLDEPRQRGGSV